MNLKNKNGTRWGRVMEGLVAGGEVPPHVHLIESFYIILKEIGPNNFI